MSTETETLIYAAPAASGAADARRLSGQVAPERTVAVAWA